MPSRRGFLAGVLAAGLAPRLGWADAGSPAYLSAARARDGSYHLCGLSDGGDLIFSLPLPGRGHAAAAHPSRPEAVAFARRPGRFALVLNCATGAETARLDAPEGRHFYGHGAFSADGTRLYTTENDLDTLDGVVGIWDASASYRRIGEMASGGVGPHELCLLPGSETLVVANGGIATHPDSGRAKLNLPMMRANLTYLSTEGAPLEHVDLPEPLRLNSIRHLAVRADGQVAAAMQWQGEDAVHPPLLMLHRMGQGMRLISAPAPQHRRLAGYAGSVAFSGGGDQVAITSPRGGAVHVFDAGSGGFVADVPVEDVCGLSAAPGGFLLSSGTGLLAVLAGETLHRQSRSGLQFDNHLVRLAI